MEMLLFTPSYQLRFLNLLKTLGHHVHLQEGSSYSYPQLVHLSAHWKVETLLEPISRLNSLAITLLDFHWNMHITFLNMPNTLEPHPYWTKESMDLSILANIGTLNSLKSSSIPKDSSNPKLNHPLCLLQKTQPMVMPPLFCQQHALFWQQQWHQKRIWRPCLQPFWRKISRTCKMVPTTAYPPTQRQKLHSWSTLLCS